MKLYCTPGARSIADPHLFVVVRWAKSNGVDLSGLNNIERFVKDMGQDAGVQKALEDEGRG